MTESKQAKLFNSLSEFEVVKEIGSGSFATVSVVKSKRDGQLYALKTVFLLDIISKWSRKRSRAISYSS